MEGENIVVSLFSGVTEYSDRKVIILPRYSIPRLPLSNAVVVCYGRVHCRIQSWIPGSVLFRLTDHLPSPSDRPHDPRLRFRPRRWGCNVPPQGEARGVMCQVLSCTTPPTRNVGGLSPETEPCEPISRRWAGPQRGTSQPYGDVSHSGPSEPKCPLVLYPGLGGEMMAGNM